jgi:hypothetical protein
MAKKAKKKNKKKAAPGKQRARTKARKRKAGTRGRTARRKTATRRQSSRKTVSTQGKAGKGGRPPAKVITIWYDASENPPIQVHKEHENIMISSDGVVWESKDYEYKTVFQGATPFHSDQFDGISPNAGKPSGSPRGGSNRQAPYKYMVIRVGTGEHLDPTIKVDP